MTDPPRLWRNRNYALFRASRLTSRLGSSISGIAYPLLVLGLGGTVFQAGTLASCQLIVSTACKLPGGHIADRSSRRLLMVGADTLRLVVVGSIPLVAIIGHLTYAQLVAVAVIEAMASAVFGPTATIALREIVPPEQITKALSQSQATGAAVSLLGPVVGGALYGVDRMLPFTADTVSYAVSAALLIGVSMRKQQAAGGQRDRRMTAGIRWLWSKRNFRRVLVFNSVIGLVTTMLIIGVIVTLREHGTPAATIGVVIACAGGGGVAGSLITRPLVALGAPRLYLLIGALWIVSLATLAAASSPWVVGLVLAVLFILAPSAGVMLSKLTLDEAPSDLLGRVSTAEQMLSTGLAAIGPVLAGVMLQAFGESVTWLVMAAAGAVITTVTIGPLLLAQRRDAGHAVPDVGADQLTAQARHS